VRTKLNPTLAGRAQPRNICAHWIPVPCSSSRLRQNAGSAARAIGRDSTSAVRSGGGRRGRGTLCRGIELGYNFDLHGPPSRTMAACLRRIDSGRASVAITRVSTVPQYARKPPPNSGLTENRARSRWPTDAAALRALGLRPSCWSDDANAVWRSFSRPQWPQDRR